MAKLRILGGLLLALALSLVPAALAQEQTFGLSAEDFALFNDANAVSSAASSLAYDFKLDLSVSGVTGGSPVLMNVTGAGIVGGTSENPLFQLTIDGSVTSDGQQIPAKLEIRLTGGVVYFTNPTAPGQWMSLKLTDVSALVNAMAKQMGLPLDTEAFTRMDREMLGQLNEFITAVSTLKPEEYVAMTRLADENGLAHINVATNLSKLVSAQGFLDAMGALAKMSGEESMSNFTPEQLQQAGTMLAGLLRNSSFNFDQYIDPGTKFISRSVLSLALNINPADVGQSSDPIAFNFTFDINLSGYNQNYSVTAPEGAVDVMQMMASAQSQ